MKRSSCNNRVAIPSRRGYTLIEMVVVISLMGTVMTVLVSILTFCMRTERTFSAEARKMQVTHSLATDLRNDVHKHEGKQISIDDQKKTLHIDKNITYRWKDHRIWREVKGEKKEQETYWFPINSQASWSKDNTSKMITLQIEMPTRIATKSKTERKTFRSLTIKAEAGRFALMNKGESR
jgi:prepilin-type N-terminal cleavage/methylation domain-containing protein